MIHGQCDSLVIHYDAQPYVIHCDAQPYAIHYDAQPYVIQAGMARVRLQLPAQDSEGVIQQLQPQHKAHRQQRSLLQAADPIVTQVPVAWSITEDELRDTLSQYKDHRLLHLTEMGHVVLNSYRAWDRRRSHASLDRWRFVLYASVD